MKPTEFEDFKKDIQPFCHYPQQDVTKLERATAVGVDSGGCLCAALSGQWSGRRLVRLQAGEQAFEAAPGGASPALAADEAGHWLAFIRYTGQWELVVSFCHQGQCQDVFIHEAGKALLMQPAIHCDQGVVLLAWVEQMDQVFRVRYVRYQGGQWGSPQTVQSSEGDCFRPALAKGEHWMLAFDRTREAGQGLTCLFLSDDLNVLEERSFENDRDWFYAPACTAAGDRYVLACVAQHLVHDPDLGIAEHDTGLAVCSWEGQAFSGLKRVASINDGLLGERLYTPYFGIRRRCQLLFDQEDLWLLWEGCPETDLAQADLPGISWEHAGRLMGQKRTKGGWHEPVILHEGGINYSVVSDQPGDLALAWVDSADLTREPQLVTGRIHLQDQLPYQAQERSGRWKPWAAPKPVLPPYQKQLAGEELQLFWGDTHVHSRLCPDAEGEPDLLVQLGRDVARLDFMCLIDNDYYPYAGMMPLEWQRVLALAAHYTVPGHFVLLPGYEFTYHEAGLSPNFNHRYVLYPRQGGFYGRTDQGSRTLEELAPLVSEDGGLLVAHHPTFRQIDHPVDRLVEICSSWRISMEEKNEIKKRLKAGDRMTFVGSSDTHRALPGLGGALTGIYATSLDPEALFEGYRKGRTIASQGNRTAIDFQVDQRFSNGPEPLETGKDRLLTLAVEAERPIEFVELIRGDQVLRRYEQPGNRLFDKLSDQAETGLAYYYVRVKLIGDPSFNEADADPDAYSGPFVRSGQYPFNFARVDGPFAWSTPIWVQTQSI